MAESGKADDSFALSVHQRLQESPPLKKVCRAQNFLQGHLKIGGTQYLEPGLGSRGGPTGAKRLSPEYRIVGAEWSAVNDWLTDPHNS